jgi:hypothetical protein
MADYIAQTRSNYFRVRNVRHFRQFCTRYSLTVVRTDEDGKYRYGFLLDGPLPTGRTDVKGEWIETDFLGELSRLLAHREIAVVMEVGSEKMRYLVGYAAAVNASGERVQISLSDIYRRCQETFGVQPTLVEY